MTGGQLGRDLAAYLRERFPLPVTVPLALILFAAPASSARLAPVFWPGGALSTWLALFCLRAADDLADLETDRQRHPQRGLVAGRICPHSLAVGLGSAWLLLFLLNLALRAGGLVLGVSSGYAAYFLWGKTRLPLWLRPAVSNLSFGLLLLYGPWLAGRLGPALVALAALGWLAAVAHEWAHNIRAETEPGWPDDYVSHYGARSSAIMAVVFFVAAAAGGLLAWLLLGRPLGFGLALLLTSLHLGCLLARLLQAPDRARARPFYVAGFTFFLLPLLVLALENLLF